MLFAVMLNIVNSMVQMFDVELPVTCRVHEIITAEIFMYNEMG